MEVVGLIITTSQMTSSDVCTHGDVRRTVKSKPKISSGLPHCIRILGEGASTVLVRV